MQNYNDYDHTRLTGIRYPNYQDNNVSYRYGGSSASASQTDTSGGGSDTPSDDELYNRIGRIAFIQHQSGTEERRYGLLGEVTREIKSITAAANGQSKVPTYATGYQFDTFGRLLSLELPDGEMIDHFYDEGGNVHRIAGTFNGTAYNYLKDMRYDEFEQRVKMEMGNGVVTDYTYSAQTRRLKKLYSQASGRDPMQDLTYGYDNVGNILSLKNAAPIPARNDMGGSSHQNFAYDSLSRLVSGQGRYDGAHEAHTYTLDMAYSEIHNITRKNQTHHVIRNGGKEHLQRGTTYDWTYAYEGTQPHAPTHIGTAGIEGDLSSIVGRSYTYDGNGNQQGWTSDSNGTRRNIVWDDENRIMEVQDPQNTEKYTYDDQGQRMVRKSKYGENAYVNQFFVVRNGAITSTHVYAGTTRIATKLNAGTPVGEDSSVVWPETIVSGDTLDGGSSTSTTTDADSVSVQSFSTQSTDDQDKINQGNAYGHDKNRGPQGIPHTGINPGKGRENRSEQGGLHAQDVNKNPTLTGQLPGAGNGNAGGSKTPPEHGGPGNGSGGNGGHGNSGNGSGGGSDGGNGGKMTSGSGQEFLYFYHPDHLGSSSYITDKNAKRYEHLEYFPFGETWVEESSNTWRTPYLFTGKEMDPQTKLYYFGARYYDPRTSVWQSADPILGEYLSRMDASGVYATKNINLFGYAHLNPLKLTDPTGKEVDELDKETQKIVNNLYAKSTTFRKHWDMLKASDRRYQVRAEKIKDRDIGPGATKPSLLFTFTLGNFGAATSVVDLEGASDWTVPTDEGKDIPITPERLVAHEVSHLFASEKRQQELERGKKDLPAVDHPTIVDMENTIMKEFDPSSPTRVRSPVTIKDTLTPAQAREKGYKPSSSSIERERRRESKK